MQGEMGTEMGSLPWKSADKENTPCSQEQQIERFTESLNLTCVFAVKQDGRRAEWGSCGVGCVDTVLSSCS